MRKKTRLRQKQKSRSRLTRKKILKKIMGGKTLKEISDEGLIGKLKLPLSIDRVNITNKLGEATGSIHFNSSWLNKMNFMNITLDKDKDDTDSTKFVFYVNFRHESPESINFTFKNGVIDDVTNSSNITFQKLFSSDASLDRNNLNYALNVLIYTLLTGVIF